MFLNVVLFQGKDIFITGAQTKPVLFKIEMDTSYKKKAERQTKAFMKSARAFLATKLTGEPTGTIPPEFELNLILLESYYKQFIMLNSQIDDMDNIVINGKYGPTLTPLCAARDKACCRLESLMKSMGLTLKSGKQLGSTEIKKEESPLDAFLKQQKSKDIEVR